MFTLSLGWITNSNTQNSRTASMLLTTVEVEKVNFPSRHSPLDEKIRTLVILKFYKLSPYFFRKNEVFEK